jgi:hypothetical protein
MQTLSKTCGKEPNKTLNNNNDNKKEEERGGELNGKRKTTRCLSSSIQQGLI